MDTIDNRPQDEDASRGDRRLLEELESLYHEVARRDQPYASAKREELMERLNKVRGAYEKMLTYWPYASGDSPIAGI